jgi:hypothetical protein
MSDDRGARPDQIVMALFALAVLGPLVLAWP